MSLCTTEHIDDLHMWSLDSVRYLVHGRSNRWHWDGQKTVRIWLYDSARVTQKLLPLWKWRTTLLQITAHKDRSQMNTLVRPVISIGANWKITKARSNYIGPERKSGTTSRASSFCDPVCVTPFLCHCGPRFQLLSSKRDWKHISLVFPIPHRPFHPTPWLSTGNAKGLMDDGHTEWLAPLSLVAVPRRLAL